MLMLLTFPASALPCPKRAACWQVRMAVEMFGEDAAINHVRSCGWTEAKIAEARKCLKQ